MIPPIGMSGPRATQSPSECSDDLNEPSGTYRANKTLHEFNPLNSCQRT